MGRLHQKIPFTLFNGDLKFHIKKRLSSLLIQVGFVCILIFCFIAQSCFSAVDFDEIRAQLKDSNWRNRNRAITELRSLSDPRAIELLKDALKDERYNNRSLAAEELEARKYVPTNVEDKILFIIARGAWNPQIWRELDKIGRPAIPYLLDCLFDGSPNVRLYAVQTLERLGFSPTNATQTTLFLIVHQQIDEVAKLGKDAVPALIPFLYSDDNSLKFKVFLKLGEIGDARAVDPIINYVYKNYDHQDMEWTAIAALGKLGDKRAINVLIPCLSTSYRTYAVDALEQLGYIPRNENEKIAFLIAKKEWEAVAEMGKHAMKRLFLFMVHPFETYQANEIAVVLEKHGFQPEEEWEKVFYLVALKKKDKLIEMGDAATKYLYKRLENVCNNYGSIPDFIDPLIIEVLGELKHKPSASLMIKLLKGLNPHPFMETGKLVKNIASALGNIEDKEAIDVLKETLPTWEANEEIGKTLEKLGWQPKTDEERVYFWICKKDVKKLNENWKLVKEILLKDFASNKVNKMENAIYTFAWLNKEEVIPELINIFNSTDNPFQLELFVKVGHPELLKAAHEWAAQRKVKLRPPPIGGYFWQKR